MKTIVTDDNSIDETLNQNEVNLPEGFHWNDAKPVLNLKDGSVIATSIPTSKFIFNPVSYGHLFFKIDP